MINTFIFDLDGTLVNTLKDLAIAYNRALKFHNLPEHKADAYKYFLGDGALKCAQRASSNNKLYVNDIMIKAMEYYAEHICDYSKPYPGICKGLLDLKKSGVNLAVLSNKPDNATKSLISNCFPENLFDIVQGFKPHGTAKPHPQGAFDIINQLDVSTETCAFIGDTSVDMKTAINTGMLPIGVKWGFRSEEELIENGAKLIWKNSKDFSILNNLISK